MERPGYDTKICPRCDQEFNGELGACPRCGAAPPNGYIQGTLIVDGALEDEHAFKTEGEFRNWRLALDAEARRDGWYGQVYVVRHDHPPNEEEPCACVQHLSDHHPQAWVGKPPLSPELAQDVRMDRLADADRAG